MKTSKITPEKTTPAKQFFFWEGQLFTSKDAFKKYLEQVKQ